MRDACADGRGRVVARAPGDRDAQRQAQLSSDLGAQMTRDGVALGQVGHLAAGHAGGVEQRVGPVAPGRVEPGRPRGVRHVADRLASQPQTQIVLGQKHPLDAGEQIGFVILHPDQLGRGEPGKDQVSADFAKARVGVQLCSLILRPAVVPQDGRAQHPVVRIKADGAMHLPR